MSNWHPDVFSSGCFFCHPDVLLTSNVLLSSIHSLLSSWRRSGSHHVLYIYAKIDYSVSSAESFDFCFDEIEIAAKTAVQIIAAAVASKSAFGIRSKSPAK